MVKIRQAFGSLLIESFCDPEGSSGQRIAKLYLSNNLLDIGRYA